MEVFEVSFADMSLSRAHTAAADLIDDEQGRGIALRFPRFKRRRPDKTIEMATTCTQIAELYSKQSKVC
jgi:DNA ligase-1